MCTVSCSHMIEKETTFTQLWCYGSLLHSFQIWVTYFLEQFTTGHTFLSQKWSIPAASLIFKRQTFVVCAILLLMLERNALIPLEVNLKKETSTLLWYWPCSGKLPCFPLPTWGYQFEMFTSRIRLNVSFLRSLPPVLSMYISEK